MEKFTNLHNIEKRFKNETVCWTYLENSRWPSQVGCVACGAINPYRLKNGRTFKCKECKKYFNVLTGTIFENTKLPLIVWFKAIYLCTSHKKGISSLQLHRDLGITQKSAWFVLDCIRKLVEEKAPVMLNGIVEIDETYVGGKSENKHQSYFTRHQKQQAAQDEKNPVYLNKAGNKNKLTNKTIVAGALQRGGKVVTKVIPNAKRQTLLPFINLHIAKGSHMVSEDLNTYRVLDKKGCTHEYVNHSGREYVRGHVHTNSIEGYWSLLKRGIIGIYHQGSPKHLHRYCNEFALRYNTRELKEHERFHHAITLTENTRLKYFELIGKKDHRLRYDPDYVSKWVLLPPFGGAFRDKI